MAQRDPRKTRMAARHRRVRKLVSGTTERPRLAVFRSPKHIYAQIIDDTKGMTLTAASSLESNIRGQRGGKRKTEVSTLVGALIASRAAENNISAVVFDRGGNSYHGRIKALADAARKGGLGF